jgi:hypothetical protein
MPSEKKAGVPKPTKTAMRVALAQIPVTHAGPVFNHKHHVFLAKLKRGEVWALNQLGLQQRPT